MNMHTEDIDAKTAGQFYMVIYLSCPMSSIVPFIWVGQVPLIVHVTGHSRMTWIYFIMLPLILFSQFQAHFLCFCPWFLP